MDKKDQMILKQLDIIRQMSEGTLRQLHAEMQPATGIYSKKERSGEITFLYLR